MIYAFLYLALISTRTPGPRLFPSSTGGRGFKPLADHLHEIGLKLGIYTSGHQCCSPKDGTDGSEGKELEDAQQFADWGIDCAPAADTLTLPGAPDRTCSRVNCVPEHISV